MVTVMVIQKVIPLKKKKKKKTHSFGKKIFLVHYVKQKKEIIANY